MSPEDERARPASWMAGGWPWACSRRPPGRSRRCAPRRGRAVGVAVVKVGDDAASGVYARRILKSAERVGADGRVVELGSTTTRVELAQVLRRLSRDADTQGSSSSCRCPQALTSGTSSRTWTP